MEIDSDPGTHGMLLVGCSRTAGESEAGKVSWRRSVRRPGLLRHTHGPAESCCLPALTRFTSARCAGPGRRTERRTGRPDDSLPLLRPPYAAPAVRRSARAAESARLEIV